MPSRRAVLASLAAAATLGSRALAAPSGGKTMQAGPARQLPKRLFGAQVQPLIENMIGDPKKAAALAPMDIAFTRFPGGTQANYYDWRKGYLVVEANEQSARYVKFWANIAPIIAKGIPNGIHYPEYADFCAKIGAQPVLLPNLENSTIPEQTEWMKALAAKGYAPTYLEMGNEFYFAMGADPDSERQWPDAKTSQIKTKAFLDAFKPYLPKDVRVATQLSSAEFWQFAPPEHPFQKRVDGWNDGVDNESWYHALTLHLYAALPSLIGADKAKPPKDQAEAKFILDALLARYDDGVEKIMAPVLKKYSDKEIWMTEWNPRGGVPSGSGDPVNQAMLMLGVARVHLTWLRYPAVTMSHYHMMYFGQNSPFTAFVPDATGDFQPLPPTKALAWFCQAANGGAEYRALRDPSVPRVSGVAGETYAPVEGALFKKAGGATALILNVRAEPYALDAAAVGAGRVPSAVETMTQPDLVDPAKNAATSETIAPAAAITLPPYSLTRIVWNA